ncbi:hypothetical protein SAMN05428970_1987 [Agromyces sp. CF514]|nr:hypothetical protein SAMN05428970_1987 [Agromyces sp. CF514]
MRPLISTLFIMAAIVMIVAIVLSAEAGDIVAVRVWASLLLALAVARSIEILHEERVSETP